MLELLLMTFRAALTTLIFGWKVLPLLDIPEPVEIVGKAVAVDPEVFRHKEVSGNQNRGHYGDGQPQRTQHMVLHTPSGRPRCFYFAPACGAPPPFFVQRQSSMRWISDYPPPVVD